MREHQCADAFDAALERTANRLRIGVRALRFELVEQQCEEVLRVGTAADRIEPVIRKFREQSAPNTTESADVTVVHE